jgi:hypothetical protein
MQIKEKINGYLSEKSGLLKKLEKFAGSKLKPGRNVIDGYPVDLDDTDGTYFEMDAVDRDACTGLVKSLRRAGFNAKRVGQLGILVTEGTAPERIDESVVSMNDIITALITFKKAAVFYHLDGDEIVVKKGSKGFDVKPPVRARSTWPYPEVNGFVAALHNIQIVDFDVK